MVDPKLVEWLISVGGALGVLCLVLLTGLIAVYKDNKQLREKLIESHNNRTADAKEQIRAYADVAAGLRSMREILQVLVDELRSNRSRR